MIACPNCRSPHSLFVNGSVEGWRDLDPKTGIARGKVESYRSDFEEDGTAGCGECEWEGLKSEIEGISDPS